MKLLVFKHSITLLMSMIEPGWNILASQIYYILRLLDWLQIMYQLVNIDLDFSPENLLHALAVVIP